MTAVRQATAIALMAYMHEIGIARFHPGGAVTIYPSTLAAWQDRYPEQLERVRQAALSLSAEIRAVGPPGNYDLTPAQAVARLDCLLSGPPSEW